MNETKVAIVSHEGKSIIGQYRERESFPDVARRVMTAARAHFMAPDENEAFAGSVAALVSGYPELPVMAEAKALGDRGKTMRALMDGVPVDFDRVELAPFPDPPLDLIGLWNETEPPRRERS